MIDWYYHQPGQGRVGPLGADEMRQRFRERSISRETLAWHAGLREWQPVERLIEELGLTGVQQDTSLPPPMPPRPAAATASHAGPMRDAAPPANRSGCLIAAIVLGVLGVIVAAILAAIALPSYRNYVERTKAAQAASETGADADLGVMGQDHGRFDAERMAATDALARELLTAAMREFYAANGNVCPDTFEFESLQARFPRYQGREDGWFVIEPTRAEGSQCAYAVGFHGLGPALVSKHARYEAQLVGDRVEIVCRNGTLPTDQLPPLCHRF